MPHADLVQTQHGPLISVITSWHEKESIKQLPGAFWGPARGLETAWYGPLSWAFCLQLRGVFGQTLTVGEALAEWSQAEYAERVAPSLALRLATRPDREVELGGLYPFQFVGDSWLITAGDALLGDEMGTGKTVQTLAAMADLIGPGGDVSDVLPALVICPNSVKRNWAREAEKWLPQAKVVVIEGSQTVRLRLLNGPAALNPNALVIVNIEATRTLSRLAPFGSTRLKRCRECDPRNGEEGLRLTQCQVHPKPLNRIAFKTVVVDEAHRIKDPQSQQTRACWALMHGSTVSRRWALTGTPLANHPGDLWSIMHGVAPLEYPTKSKFVDRYALTGWNAYGGLDIIGLQPERKDEFYRFFDPRFRRMPKALVLDQLPPKVRAPRYVEMTPKQAKAYGEIETGLVTRLADGTVLVAPSNLAAQTRLLQFSSSYASLDAETGTVTLTEPSPKLDALEEVLDELGDRPVAVCAVSRQLVYLAAARLDKRKISYGLITGKQKEWERDIALRQFQDGKLRVLLFTVQAGGVGLTMTAADTIVFLQRSWSMIDNRQAEDRVHRIGSEVHESITVIDIITRDTVEEAQLERLAEKMARLEEITRDRATLALHGQDTSELDALEEQLLAANLGSL